jgi:hypothetical protein
VWRVVTIVKLFLVVMEYDGTSVLSVNLLLMVVERVEGVRELASLSQVSHLFRDVVERGVRGWVQLQPVGVGLETFSDQEVCFVRQHVECAYLFSLSLLEEFCADGSAVFQELAVSITCSVGAESPAEWWLTRESGKLPSHCGVQGCWACATFSDGGKVPPQAVLVVKAQGILCEYWHQPWMVCVALLSAEELQCVEHYVSALRIGFSLCDEEGHDGCEEKDEYWCCFTRFKLCMEHVMCTRHPSPLNPFQQPVDGEGMRIEMSIEDEDALVEQYTGTAWGFETEGFEGIRRFSSRGRGWWTGVTDAVGVGSYGLDGNTCSWMNCPSQTICVK